MAYPGDCGNFFDCTDLKNLTLEQALKMLFKPDANGCPALNILGTVDTGGVPVVVNRVPNLYELNDAVINPATPINVVSFSLLFFGVGGSVNGVPVPDKYQVNYGNGTQNINTPMPLVVPPGGRIVISTLA